MAVMGLAYCLKRSINYVVEQWISMFVNFIQYHAIVTVKKKANIRVVRQFELLTNIKNDC